MEALIEAVPPKQWVPFLLPAFEFRPSVLSIGRALDTITSRELAKVGVVEHAPSLGAAMRIGTCEVERSGDRREPQRADRRPSLRALVQVRHDR